MNATDYQRQAARTLIDEPQRPISPNEMMILWNALGLAGEAGEVCEAVKKGILHQHGLDHDKLAKELGDVCWYLAALCTKCGFDLGEIMAANIEKLKVRYPDGFKPEDSVKRVDTEPELDWDKAKAHLELYEKEYRAIGAAGRFDLAMTIMPLKDRLDKGERTKWLYDEIMEVK